MLVLYDNPFSPFARKVRMALDFKGFTYRSVDALSIEQLPGLRDVNARGEVPVLVDDDIVAIDSADIAAYLDDLRPEPSLLPASLQMRAKARHWHRVADRTLDAIIHDVSLWTWPTHHRTDQPPSGLLEAGRQDLEAVMRVLERAIEPQGFICGTVSIADFAVFPHVTSLRFIGVDLDKTRYPRLREWLARMRDLECVRKDLESTRLAAIEKFGAGKSPYESDKVVWRGDRIEWLLARGFDAWWNAERATGRAVIPQPSA